MQSVSSRIWTRVAVSISCDDNHDTMGTFWHLGVVAIEKGAFWSPSITVANFTFYLYGTLILGSLQYLMFQSGHSFQNCCLTSMI